MSSKSNRLFIIKSFGTLAMISVLWSCNSTDIPDKDQMEYDPVRIGGSMASFSLTKAYDEDLPESPKDINSGIFNLLYPSSATGGSQATYASVNFDLSNDGIGFVTTLNGSELQWNEVAINANNSFILDNVPQEYTTDKTNPVTVSFSPDDSPYRAGILSETNDLLWGKASTVQPNTKSPVEVELHHKMSLLRIWVNSKIDLSQATVTITNIVPHVNSFNRTTGVTIVGKNYSTNLLMVSPDDPELNWTLNGPDLENPNNDLEEFNDYVTKNFVIPPQTLVETASRSQLKITVTENGETQTYIGYLPYSMKVEGEDGDYASSLEFLSEKFLTIKTTIDAGNPVLEFEPVTYVDWINKGKFTINAYQEGVYNNEDFMSLIGAIKGNNELQMSRYGYKQNNTWNFQIWSDLSLSVDEYIKIYGVLSNVNVAFKFTIGAHIITIDTGNNGSIEINEENIQDLVEILKGT